MTWGNAVEEKTGDEAFGKALRRIRNERGVSLAELARLTKYSKGHLSNVEHGRKRAHLAMAVALDVALDAGGELRTLCETPAALPGQRATPCPYRGLAHFGVGDTRWFFGRTAATTDLVDRVASAVRGGGPVVVFGASGSGKSSLLRAGLLPAVARGELPAPPGNPRVSPGASDGRWRCVVVTPTARPVDALVRALTEPLGTTDVRALAERVRAGSVPPGTEHVLLVVDQLEEVFTLCEDETERAAYLDVLCALPLAVLAVRADFFDRCLTHPGLVRALQRRPLALGAMSRGELAETVERPAALAGTELEPGLLAVLLHDLDPGGHGYDPGALPLLSHALLATWQQRTGRRLTVEGYRRTGGIRGAVATTAERTYLDLRPEDRAAARELILRMVQVGEEGGDSRRCVERSALGQEAGPALEAFTRARLLTVDSARVEITHEALLRAWPRLAGWIDADRAGLRTRQRLTEAAEDWERHGRRSELLWQGAVLSVAAQWAADHPGRADEREQAFLAASDREARRGLRRLRRALAALIGLVVVVVLVAVVAVDQRAVAVREGKAADRGQQAARAVALAEGAGALRSADPALAATLAVAAYREDPGAPQARDAVSGNSGLPYPVPLRGNGDKVSAIAFGAGGTVALGTREGLVRVWRQPLTRTRARVEAQLRFRPPRVVYGMAFAGAGEADGGRALVIADSREIRVWRTHGSLRPTPGPLLWAVGGGRDVRVSRDGRTVAVACADGVLRRWDLSDPVRPVPLPGLDAGRKNLVSVSVSREGSLIATGDGADEAGAAVVWARRADGRYAHADTVLFPGRRVTEAALAPDGRRLAIGLDDGSLWMCALDRRGVCRTRAEGEHAGNFAAGMAYSPDGSLLAEAASGGALLLRDPLTGTVLLTLEHPTPLQSLAWAPDGATLFTGADAGGTAHAWRFPLPVLLGHTGAVTDVATHDGRGFAATASTDGTARLWDVSVPERPKQVGRLEHAGGVSAVVFDPAGRRLATGTADGQVRLWDVTRPARPRLLDRVEGHDEDVTALAFAPHGTRLASASYDDHTFLWDVRPDATLLRRADLTTPSTAGVSDVAFGLGGRLVATAESDGKVRVWDGDGHPTRRDGHPTRRLPMREVPLHELPAHEGIATTVAFAGPRSGLLASGGQDGAVQLWRVDPRRALREPRKLPEPPRRHTRYVTRVTFAADGRTLLSAAEDGTAALWNVIDPYRPVVRVTLRAPGESFTGAAPTEGGRRVLTASGSVVRLWSADATAAAARTCATSGAPLTREGWRRRLPDFDYRKPCD
ncbi:helix-turn-helix domain-containing protein [Streptomyces sp. NBC_00075]|uniref:nSTAND1 domain-containing NTPase n=1 Tax=Streptomyces sp. NBC_00075 TaxID=2975641 RepID=UPI00324ECA19